MAGYIQPAPPPATLLGNSTVGPSSPLQPTTCLHVAPSRLGSNTSARRLRECWSTTYDQKPVTTRSVAPSCAHAHSPTASPSDVAASSSPPPPPPPPNSYHSVSPFIHPHRLELVVQHPDRVRQPRQQHVKALIFIPPSLLRSLLTQRV
ncbi:hypothetical protein CTA1_11476 [Colletotrichum tanaceti]|uniref:Uncharacterized protein n=1 Tax=Colletotrichum tanaceti TaxID=1306861 RepID=A0A4U6XTX2_9PEZI|nr:hypothetical protein CTA1_11476 [Colletotrichum tanaceti]